MKKVFTSFSIALLSVVTATATNAFWNMGDFNPFKVESGTTEVLTDANGNELTCYPSVELEANTKHFGGVEYTGRLKLGGSIGWSGNNPKQKCVAFPVDGPCDIEFGVLSGSNNKERTLTLYVAGTKEVVGSYTTAVGDDNGESATISYTGEAATLVFGANNGMNFYYIKVTPAGAAPQLAMPAISYEVNDTHTEAIVTITSVEGATVHYTTDGSEPTADSPEYTAPFSIVEEGAVVKAIAISNDTEVASDSPIASTVIEVWERVDTPFFVWNNTEGAEDYLPTGGTLEAVSSDMAVNVVYSFPAQGISYNVIQVASKESTADEKYILLTLDQALEAGDVISVTAFRSNADNGKASGLLMIPQDASASKITIGNGTTFIDIYDAPASVNEETGEETPAHTVFAGEPNTVQHVVTAAEAGASEYKLVRSSSQTNLRITSLRISRIEVVDPEASAITSISNDTQAPVEYYNLQGVRVANPANGIYIMRCGEKVSKVLVK